MRIFIAILFTLLFYQSFSQTVTPIIDTSFTLGGDQMDRMFDALEMENRQVLLGGHSYSSNSIDVGEWNNGDQDIWIMRHDTADLFGSVWSRTFGGDSTDVFADFELLDDGFVVAGSSVSGISGNKNGANRGGFDYWVFRCNFNGDIIWEQTFGGNDHDSATCITVHPDGGFVIGGTSWSDNNGDKSEVNKGEADYWILKLSENGALEWQATIGGDAYDAMSDVYPSDSGLVCVGSSTSGAGFDKTDNSFGGSDVWVVNLDLQGNIIRDATYGGNRNDFGVESLTDADGDLYICATTYSNASGNKTSVAQGGADTWLLRLDSSGQVDLDLTFGGRNDDFMVDALRNPEGGIAVGATTNSGGDGNKSSVQVGGSDFWIYKINDNGAKIWDFTYGGSGSDIMTSLEQGCSRGYLLGGYSNSNESGDKEQDSYNSDDYWFIRTLLPTRPQFSLDDVCLGTTVDFFDESDVFPDTWSWNFGDPTSGNNTSTDQHPQHSYSSPGDYVVTLTVREGCQRDTSVSDTITILPNPILNVMDLGPDGVICEGESRVLDPGDMPAGTTFEWSTGEITPTIVTDTIGVFVLTIRNGQCRETGSVELDWCPVFTEEYQANIFTPNGDGINDRFYITGKGIREVDWYIYNRWGQVIYHSKNLSEGWDGTFMGNGKTPVMNGVYPYKLFYSGLGTEVFEAIGNVTLLR